MKDDNHPDTEDTGANQGGQSGANPAGGGPGDQAGAGDGASGAQPTGAGGDDQAAKKPTSGQLKSRGKHIFVIPPHPNTTFDEENFLTLLEGSISLTLEEKKRVIDAIPRLSIEQINELIAIFEEEKEKFKELEEKFADDVQKLKSERERELDSAEVKKEEVGESEEDAAQADEIRKQLGL